MDTSGVNKTPDLFPGEHEVKKKKKTPNPAFQGEKMAGFTSAGARSDSMTSRLASQDHKDGRVGSPERRHFW